MSKRNHIVERASDVNGGQYIQTNPPTTVVMKTERRLERNTAQVKLNPSVSKSRS